jgi:lipoprotein-anchoring transpeptidase ErfK/SrfK
VLGVSAYSQAAQGWARGNPIGIHGTNEPWSVGHAASHGCVRVPNAVAARLVGMVAAGTPVEIRA